MQAGLLLAFHSSQPVCNRLKRRGHPPLCQQSGLHALYFIIYQANPLLAFLGLQTTLTLSKNIYVHDISLVFSVSTHIRETLWGRIRYVLCIDTQTRRSVSCAVVWEIIKTMTHTVSLYGFVCVLYFIRGGSARFYFTPAHRSPHHVCVLITAISSALGLPRIQQRNI